MCACRGYTCHERLANTWSLLYKKGFKTKKVFINNLATIKKLNILLWKWDTRKLHYRSWQMFEGFLSFPHTFLMTCKSPVWLGQSVSVHFPFFVCLRVFWGYFLIGPLQLSETWLHFVFKQSWTWCGVMQNSITNHTALQAAPSLKQWGHPKPRPLYHCYGILLYWLIFFCLFHLWSLFSPQHIISKGLVFACVFSEKCQLSFWTAGPFLLLLAWFQCIYVQAHSNCKCSHSDANSYLQMLL